MAKIGAEIRVAVTLEPIPLYILMFAEAGNVFENFQKTDIFIEKLFFNNSIN